VLTHHVAEAAPEDIADAILAAALEYTDAGVAYITMLNDSGSRIADGSTLTGRDAFPIAILRGLADWVIHAADRIEVPDVSQSAWCRYLAGTTPPALALVGMPLLSHGQPRGGIVIGGDDPDRIREWTTTLTTLVEAGSDAFMLARRLVETGGGELVDRPSGAYNARFLEDLLEKEISRAGRHNNDLSLVFFHADNYNEMLHRLGPEATERALSQMVDVMRSRTRKVNSLARISQTDFCLVVPEADGQIAEKIAHDLQTAAQEHPFTVDMDSGSQQVQIELHTRTLSNPRDPDEALLQSLGVN
jgi:diguanylate cyclase (GGDEF)-like protein